MLQQLQQYSLGRVDQEPKGCLHGDLARQGLGPAIIWVTTELLQGPPIVAAAAERALSTPAGYLGLLPRRQAAAASPPLPGKHSFGAPCFAIILRSSLHQHVSAWILLLICAAGCWPAAAGCPAGAWQVRARRCTGWLARKQPCQRCEELQHRPLVGAALEAAGRADGRRLQ